jgi:hypothetical protein
LKDCKLKFSSFQISQQATEYAKAVNIFMSNAYAPDLSVKISLAEQGFE